MSDAHEHNHPAPTPPETPVDTRSQALEDALRSSFFIVKAVLLVMVVVFIFSGMRSVGPQERAVVLRFGKPVGVDEERLLKPGLHWAWPFPIEEIVTIRVGEIQSVTSTVGWFAQTKEQELAGAEPPPLASLNPATEGYLLTGDGNIVHAKATMRYRISDPLAYHFNFTNASEVIQNILDNSLIYAAAHSIVGVNYAALSADLKDKLVARLTQQLGEQKLGVTLEPVDVKVVMPRYVRDAFDQVLVAEQEKSRLVLAAQGYEGTNRLAALATATALTIAAETDRKNFVQAVAKQAESFSNLLPQYESNPELLRQRLLTETWQRILADPNVEKWFRQPLDGKPYELRLQLNREPRAPQPQSQP